MFFPLWVWFRFFHSNGKIVHSLMEADNMEEILYHSMSWIWSGFFKVRHNIPCHVNDVSCGKECGKPLNCGHKCLQICHRVIQWRIYLFSRSNFPNQQHIVCLCINFVWTVDIPDILVPWTTENLNLIACNLVKKLIIIIGFPWDFCLAPYYCRANW